MPQDQDICPSDVVSTPSCCGTKRSASWQLREMRNIILVMQKVMLIQITVSKNFIRAPDQP